MVGYTTEGASGAQWFANPPPEVWAAAKDYIGRNRTRNCDDRLMTLDAGLGMGAFTGNVIVNISVQPAPQGGSVLQFSARMGAFSRGQIGAQRRIESERSKFMSAVVTALPPAAPASSLSVAPSPSQGSGIVNLVEQLRQLSELHASGSLSDEEFEAAKRTLLA